MIIEQQPFPSLWDLPFHRTSSLLQPLTPPLPIVSQSVSSSLSYIKHNNPHINEYQFICPLGAGSYGTVHKVQRTYLDDQKNITQSIYAMKVHNKRELQGMKFMGPNGEEMDKGMMLRNELNIVRRLDHRNLVRCYQIIEDEREENVFSVMEYCDIGDIMVVRNNGYERNKRVVWYLEGKYGLKRGDTQNLAKIIFRQVAQALLYLHQRNITHRDIKPENIMVRSEDSWSQVKLGDFSTVRYSTDNISNQAVGTVFYRSPEQVFAREKGYFVKAGDIWALGVSMWVYCFERLPFGGEGEEEVMRRVGEEEVAIPEGKMSKEMKELIGMMMSKDECKRPKIQEVLRHPWFTTP